MTVRLVVSIDAPAKDHDHLTVQDAFEQILDLFDLAVYGDSDPEKVVVWRLVTARMNSPLTVVAEAVGARPGINIDMIAESQRNEFVRNFGELRGGRIPSAWSGPTAKAKARNVIARNRKGIGKTSIYAGTQLGITQDMQPLIVVTDVDADAAVHLLEDTIPKAALNPKDQIGSIEGYLIQVGTHYGSPAIQVRERKTNAVIWCVIPNEFREQIADEANFDDVWSGRRIRLRGRITYNQTGDIARIFASEIHRVDPVPVSVEKIQDTSFTGGMSVAEYLEKLREGSIG